MARGAKVGCSVAVPGGMSESIRIRPISNGFLITRSGTKAGRYTETEEFSPTKPVITAEPAPKRGK